MNRRDAKGAEAAEEQTGEAGKKVLQEYCQENQEEDTAGILAGESGKKETAGEQTGESEKQGPQRNRRKSPEKQDRRGTDGSVRKEGAAGNRWQVIRCAEREGALLSETGAVVERPAASKPALHLPYSDPEALNRGLQAVLTGGGRQLTASFSMQEGEGVSKSEASLIWSPGSTIFV
ncbi:MAG: hypothetical protein ACLTAF_02805 [Blautia coccoides]